MSECKPSSELLTAIQGADTKTLKDVTPVENPAAKHDMAMVGLILYDTFWLFQFEALNKSSMFQFGVEKFDKSKLKDVETVEKNVLPTAEDIQQAKTEEASWCGEDQIFPFSFLTIDLVELVFAKLNINKLFLILWITKYLN